MLKTPWLKGGVREETAIPPALVRDSSAKWVGPPPAPVRKSSHPGAEVLRPRCGSPPRRGLTEDPPLTFARSGLEAEVPAEAHTLPVCTLRSKTFRDATLRIRRTLLL